MFDFSSQSSPHANMAIRKLCDASADCTRESDESAEDTFEKLRTADATNLQINTVAFAYNNIPDFPIWSPVKFDGEFFKSDAEEMLKTGQIPHGV